MKSLKFVKNPEQMSKKLPKPVKYSREELVAHTNIKALWKNAPKCQNCEAKFEHDRAGRRPFLLPCGHSLCEACCSSKKIFWRYKCKLCQASVSVRDANNWHEFLEHDHHMTGMLAAMAWKSAIEIVLPDKKATDPKKKVCNENCGTEIESSCRHCNVPLCKTCFDRIHLSSKTFQHHVFVENDEIEFTVEEYTSICQTHSSPAIKYCNTCMVELCTVCETQRIHKTHIIKTTAELNKDLPLKQLINRIAEAIKLNETGIKNADALLASHKKSALDAIDQITGHFVHLHGQLQRKESETLAAVKAHLQSLLDTSNSHRNAMLNIGVELNVKQKQLHFIASLTETTFLCKNFVDEGIELLMRPCSKEFPNAHNVDVSPFQINLHENGVETHFKSDCTETSEVHIELGGRQRVEIVEDEHAEKSVEEREYVVYVVNVMSPFEIYVQTKAGQATLKKLFAVCEKEFNAKDIPKIVNMHGMYLIRNKASFYRGRITKAVSHDLYNVELIDTAKSIQVSIKNIRDMSKTIRSFAGLAQKCALFGIKLNNAGSGPVMAVDFLQKFLACSPMHMYTYTMNTKGVALVDFQPSNQPISAQKALVTLNLATYESTYYTAQDMVCLFREKMKKHVLSVPRMHIRKSSLEQRRFQAYPLVINNPSDFYIMDLQHVGKIQQINKMLTKSLPIQLLVPRPDHYCTVIVGSQYNVYRAKIINLLDNGLYQVFLIDQGKMKEVKYSDIRELPEEYYTIYPAAIWCSLIDIKPVDIEAGWSAEAVKAFKTAFTVKDTKYVAWLFSEDKCTEYFDAVIYQVTNIFEVCLNGKLVTQKHAISCGTYGNEDTINKQDSKNEVEEFKGAAAHPGADQHMVDLLEFRSPSEFYLTLWNKSEGADNLERQIQAYMKNKIIDETYMKVNQKCLVFLNHKWYRGEIKSLSEVNYNVYVIDTGKTVSVNSDQLAPIPKIFEEIEPKVLKCHMANLAPPAGCKIWPGGAIDYIENLINLVSSFTINIVGTKTGDSLPVVLYGRQTSALDHTMLNMNDALQQTGFARTIKQSVAESVVRPDVNGVTEEKPTKLEELTQELAYLEMTGKLSDDELDKRTSRIERLANTKVKYDIFEWIEPEPLQKTVFSATPTYVTKNGLIFMHDNMHQDVLDTIKDDIIHFMRRHNPAAYQEGHKYDIGQPCIAEYHLDKKWYRATVVKKLTSSQFIVQFVDYGNVERVTSDRMLKCFVDYDIPIQAHCFKLCGIKPANETRVWTTKIIDNIHAMIVNRICSIRCFPDKQTVADMNKRIMPCTVVVECDNIDVIEAVLVQGWAVRTDDGFEHQKFVSLHHDLDGEVTMLNETQPIVAMETTFDCFEPQETSSRAQTPINVSSITYPELSEYFAMLNIDEGIASFQVHVARAIAPGMLYIIPNIHKGLYYFDFMERLQIEVGAEPLENPALHSTCLIQVEGQWNRGIIVSLKQNKIAEVLLVDTLDVETTDVNKLKPLPKELQEIPLWCIKAQITNDTINVEELNDYISNRSFFVKIVGTTLHAYIVELFDSESLEAPFF